MPEQTPTCSRICSRTYSWRRFGSIRTYARLDLELRRRALRKAQSKEKKRKKPHAEPGRQALGMWRFEQHGYVERWKANDGARSTAWRASCGSMCGRVCVCAGAEGVAACRVVSN
jgi:hypothetical protein